MIMPRGQELLLPASPVFIWSSLLLALLLNMVVGMLGGSTSAWTPDFLIIVLAFWTVHQPRRIGGTTAFLFGLAMDIHQTSLLGQHALAYTLLSFGSIMIHRRLLWFPVPKQALQVLPLFVATHLIVVVTGLISGKHWPGWELLLPPLIEMMLWPVFSVLLLAPQRRAPDPDANRPL